LGNPAGNPPGAQRDGRDRITAAGPKNDRSRGRLVKDAVRKSLKDRQNALTNLIHAIRELRKLVDQPLTLRGSDYAQAVQELNKAIDRAEELLQ
jgi:hypothetical protein